MKTSTLGFLSVPLLITGSIALSGCGRSTSAPTLVSYHQVGVCKAYDTPNGTEDKQEHVF